MSHLIVWASRSLLPFKSLRISGRKYVRKFNKRKGLRSVFKKKKNIKGLEILEVKFKSRLLLY